MINPQSFTITMDNNALDSILKDIEIDTLLSNIEEIVQDNENS